MDHFEQLVEQYKPMMHKIIHSLRIFKNHEHFYSIAMQALWEASIKYDNRSSTFSTYAFTIIRGRLLNELRKESRYDKSNIPSLMELQEYNEKHSYVHDYFAEEGIINYCEQLTEKQKTWVIHTFVYDHSLDTIAAIYQVDKTIVKSWRKSALSKLRKLVKEEV